MRRWTGSGKLGEDGIGGVGRRRGRGVGLYKNRGCHPSGAVKGAAA